MNPHPVILLLIGFVAGVGISPLVIEGILRIHEWIHKTKGN